MLPMTDHPMVYVVFGPLLLVAAISGMVVLSCGLSEAVDWITLKMMIP